MKITTPGQFEKESGQWARLKQKLEKVDSALDEKITKLQEAHEEKYEQDRKNMQAIEEALLNYAEDNKEEMFSETEKTFETPYAAVKIRKTAPTLKYLRGWNEEKLIETIKKKYKNWIERFIKVKESRNTSVIKAAIKSGELDDDKLKSIGLKLEQKESISLKLK